MLSAQKQKKPEDASSENSAPPPSGFGKVLSSIQGLQQRLDDFSAEEVSRAHARAADLIKQLGALHGRLGALAKLQNAFTVASADIASRPAIDFQQIDADSLDNHPQLRAIVQAGKLIRMHRLLRAAQASAEAVPLAFPTEPMVSVSANQTKSTGEVRDEVPLSNQSYAPASESNLKSIERNTAAPEEAHPPVTGAFTLVNSVYESSPAGGGYDFCELKLEDAPAHGASQNTAAQGATPIAETVSKRPRGNAAFDERLLGDLIDTYGEFAASADVVMDQAAAAPIEPVVQDPLPQSVVAPTIALPPVESTPEPVLSRELIVVEDAKNTSGAGQITAPEPAFVTPIGDDRLALPAPEEEIAEPAFEQTLPNAKARGEIDRQLKSIIKDYGQVDLYSHGKSVNTKTAAIAAAAALALMLGGIYFFKASSANPPVPVETSAPTAETTPSTTAVKNQPKTN